jgi:biuret amidohydrolase
MMAERKVKVAAEPYDFEFDPRRTALLLIDMQRDFVEPGGFGEQLGNDVSRLRRVIPPLQRLLTAMREEGYLVIHTREGHRPDLSDCPPTKLDRGRLRCGIGDAGPMGRVLTRGSY